MHRLLGKTGRLALIVALFAATGGHWAVLQSVAWSAMLVRYSHESGIAIAVEKTFDGQHPCALCDKISKARSDGKKQPSELFQSKLEFCQEPVSDLLCPPDRFSWMFSSDLFSQRLVNQPPNPPPRI